jgi:Zn finger protein HypA/HybF involved in hydrogenase expression
MPLEERSVDHLRRKCESCGAGLTDPEIKLALDQGAQFLCSSCASQQVEVEEADESA